MTTKATDHPVHREVNGLSHGPLIASITEHDVTLRPKGRREASAVTIPWGVVFLWAVKHQVEQARPARRTRRIRQWP